MTDNDREDDRLSARVLHSNLHWYRRTLLFWGMNYIIWIGVLRRQENRLAKARSVLGGVDRLACPQEEAGNLNILAAPGMHEFGIPPT